MKNLVSKAMATAIAVLIALITSNQVLVSSEVEQIEIIDKNTAFLVEENISFYSPKDLTHLERVLITAIVDGDTITIKDLGDKESQVRLLGINTDEVDTFDANKECLGDEATFTLATLLRGSRFAYIQRDYSNRDVDDLGRLLRYVYIRHPKNNEIYIDLSETMLSLGYAEVYDEFPLIRKQMYIEREFQAKEKREVLLNQCQN